MEGAPGGAGCAERRVLTWGEAEQLGCGQVVREGISPRRQLRQKCLRRGEREEGLGLEAALGSPDHRQLCPRTDTD